MTRVLAVVDLAAAVWLLWSLPRQRRNREVMAVVARLVLGVGGLLGVLTLT